MDIVYAPFAVEATEAARALLNSSTVSQAIAIEGAFSNGISPKALTRKLRMSFDSFYAKDGIARVQFFGCRRRACADAKLFEGVATANELDAVFHEPVRLPGSGWPISMCLRMSVLDGRSLSSAGAR